MCESLIFLINQKTTLKLWFVKQQQSIRLDLSLATLMIFQSSVSIISDQSPSMGTIETQTNGLWLHLLDSQSHHFQNVSWVQGDDNNLRSNSNTVCVMTVFIYWEFV